MKHYLMQATPVAPSGQAQCDANPLSLGRRPYVKLLVRWREEAIRHTENRALSVANASGPSIA